MIYQQEHNGELVEFEKTEEILENHGHSIVFLMEGRVDGKLKYFGDASFTLGGEDIETEIENIEPSFEFNF